MKIKKEVFYTIMLLFCMCLLVYSVLALKGREYYFVSLAIILTGVVIFVLGFENRKPTVAELTIIAVMCAIAVVARVSFFFLPQIKPIAAIVIITGISLGAESGFVTGVISAFVSNFSFGQGGHTPFQMFALGIIGFFAGLIFKKVPINRITLSIYGAISVLVLYGGIVDINTLFYSMGENTWDSIVKVYSAGFVMNLAFAGSTVVFLIMLYKPVLSKLTRVKKKYHLIGEDKEKSL